MRELEHRLAGIVRDTSWLYRALVAARSLHLPEWCIGAGAVRNAVWDALHGYWVPTPPADIDVAYFDPGDISQEHDDALQGQLALLEPDLPWEVTNQAGVHLWFEQGRGCVMRLKTKWIFGYAGAPLGSHGTILIPTWVTVLPHVGTTCTFSVCPDHKE